MTHEEAWVRLPDLLDDRDDPALLGHVRGCAACQRQLFLLGRVDRLLRDTAPSRHRRGRAWRFGASAVAAAAALAVSLTVFAHSAPPARDFMLRTASGRSVGRALIGRSDARNLSLALTARGLPVNSQHVFVLWAGDDGATMEVGRFMVDRSGGCRARFNLPATHDWRRFWVAQPGNAGAVVAST